MCSALRSVSDVKDGFKSDLGGPAEPFEIWFESDFKPPNSRAPTCFSPSTHDGGNLIPIWICQSEGTRAPAFAHILCFPASPLYLPGVSVYNLFLTLCPLFFSHHPRPVSLLQYPNSWLRNAGWIKGLVSSKLCTIQAACNSLDFLLLLTLRFFFIKPSQPL